MITKVQKYLTPILYQVPSSRVNSRHHLTSARVAVCSRSQFPIPETVSGFCPVWMYKSAPGLNECLDSKHMPPVLRLSVTERFSAQFFIEKQEKMMTALEAKRSSALYSFFPIILTLQSPFGKIDYVGHVPQPELINGRCNIFS